MPSNKGVDCGEIDEQACSSTSSKTSDQQTVQNNHPLKDNSSPHRSSDEPNSQEFLNTLHQHHTLSDEEDTMDPKLRNSQFIWTSPMVYGLIEEYQKLIVQFRDPKLRQKDLWIKVANGMRTKGFNVDYQMCDRKWRNLKQTFKSIYYDQRKKRQRTWEFYEILQIIFAPDNTRVLRKSRMVLPIPETDENDDRDNDNLLAPVQKRKRIRYSKTDYYSDHAYEEPITEPELQTVVYNQNEISRDCTEDDDDEEEEENEDHLNEDFTFEELEVHYKEVEGPAWFRTAMENLRADQRARVIEARRMHRELLEAEKRKCDLLEALLRVLQPPQG